MGKTVRIPMKYYVAGAGLQLYPVKDLIVRQSKKKISYSTLSTKFTATSDLAKVFEILLGGRNG